MAHQTRTIELRKWFVDGDCDLDLNPCYVIRHLIGENETCYGWWDEDNIVAYFYDKAEAERVASKLNNATHPETYTYSEWRE